MILVIAGTQDGRELVQKILAIGVKVAASVVSSYGEKLLANGNDNLIINDKPLNESELNDYLNVNHVTMIVDASHPYAVNVSKNAMLAAQRTGVPYIRYERDVSKLNYDKLQLVYSYEEAAETAAKLGKNVFLTIGSRNLAKFTTAAVLKNNVITARVLPSREVIELCENLGLMPKQIVAMQGPFSIELNTAMFLNYQADVVVTKNSGSIGGTDTKLEAAKTLDLPVVVIDRPKLNYANIGHTYEEILAFIKEYV